jgi:hypothetical protein
MLKVGRYTAAILLVTVGVLLLLDQTTGSDHLSLILDWWPVLLIMLGFEYLIFNFMYRKGERQLRLDLGGLVLSVLISAAVVGTTQADRLPTKWLQNIDFDIDTLHLSFSSESGHKFEKGTTTVPVTEAVKRIFIDNPNGSVEVAAGSVTDIEVKATVWVDKVEQGEAAAIADGSFVDYTEGATLRVTARGKEYTGGFSNKRKPRMNLVVTVPRSLKADYELQLRNGGIAAKDIAMVQELKAHTSNGPITISDIQGNVDADTTNGAIELNRITGSVSADTTNGAVVAKTVGGSVSIDTTNGAVIVEQAGGQVKVDTTNGRISILEAASGIKADATNGGITVATHTVGGDYDLDTMASPIEVRIPETANVEVKGSTSLGSITTNLPFTVDGKKISGQLGTGQFKIKLETNNKIELNRID